MLAATDTAVYRIEDSNNDAPIVIQFQEKHICALACGANHCAIALKDGTIWMISHVGSRQMCRRMEEPIESLLILNEDPLKLLVGTEGAHLYSVEENDIIRISAFEALECRDSWHTPWGGPPSVRTLALTTDGWIYADIHVGSIIRSSDRGRTWQPVTDQLDEDVHQVATCRSAPDCVYANTAQGVYISDDRGQSWQHRAKDLDNRYGRAIAVAPNNPDLLLATVSDGPHGDNVHGRLYRSEDRGRSWRHVKEGFPDSVAENINTCHVVFDSFGSAWAIVGRKLYLATEAATVWKEFWEAPSPLRNLAVFSTSFLARE